MADFRTAQPVEYYRKFLEQDVRPDGRELGEIRPTVVNIGSITTADGSSLVKLGNTTVICGIKAELCTPALSAPNQGMIVPNVDLPPLCSSKFKAGPPGEQAQVLSQLMLEVIRNSKCIDVNELCIQKGKLAWVLYCDLMCLDYDGSLNDACVIALIAALRSVSLPSVIINEETDTPETNLENMSPLNIASQPVATSFGIFDDQIIFVDPTNEEESMATGMVTIVTDENDKLCLIHKPGGSPLSESQLQNCLQRALVRGREVRRMIDETLHSVER